MTGRSVQEERWQAGMKAVALSSGGQETMPSERVDGKNGSKQKAGSKALVKSVNKKGEMKKSPNVSIPSTSGKTKEFSLEEKAAIIIQCAFRQFLARKQMAKRKKEKQEYQELMDRLEKEAFVAMVKKEQEEVERQRQKEEEERKKKLQERQRKKRILEASFEGDVDEILAVLKEVSDLDTQNGIGYDERGKALRLRNQLSMVDCTDANGNTPLSEAAGGGHPSAIKLLIERGAQPNSKGVFGRTPLYRAAFGAHLAAVELLLQYGADPRIYADDGYTPEQVASMDGVVGILHSWNTSLTESMLQNMEAERQRRILEEQKLKKADTDRMKDEVLQLTKEYERCQKELQQAYSELNRRITEHDKCVRKQMDKTELTLQCLPFFWPVISRFSPLCWDGGSHRMVTHLVLLADPGNESQETGSAEAVHDAEMTVESLRLTTVKGEEKMTQAKLRLREQIQDGSASGLPGLKCSVQELDEVLMKDVGNRVHQDGRWPLVIDPTGQAATFLRYRDTNYLDTLNPAHMQAETIRLALLGALRYGKPLVFDMMELNMFNTVTRQLDEIQAGLTDELLNKSLLKKERYLSLVRPTDGLEYSRTHFQTARTENFKLFIITKLHQPPEALLSLLLPIEVLLTKLGA